VAVGALTMPVVLGSEWAHNLAHAAVAGWIGRPMDAIRVVWGMPILVYYDVEDQSVSPRQHVARALGGPAVNATLFSAASLLYPRTRPGSVARDLVQAAVHTNAFLCLVGLLPIPGIDGGPILKWSLVEWGHTPAAANRIVHRVDGVLGVILAVLGWLALKRRHRLLGGLLLQMAALAWAFALGLIKEQDQVATR
jgi:Zn-dependent protease